MAYQYERLVCNGRSAVQSYFHGTRRSKVARREWRTPNRSEICYIHCSGSRLRASEDRCAPSPTYSTASNIAKLSL